MLKRFSTMCGPCGPALCGGNEHEHDLEAFISKENILYPHAHRAATSSATPIGNVEDPYRWLENPDGKDTRAWVDAQNDITFGYLDKLENRQKIKDRMLETYNYPKYSCPFKRGEWFYTFRNDGLQNQDVLHRQRTLTAEPEVFLDPNTIEEDGTAALGVYKFSHDGSFLAYGVSRSGSDWQTIYVRDAKTCRNLEDEVEDVKFSSIAWTHDNKGFFYARYPAPPATHDGRRGSETVAVKFQKVYYHEVGTPQSDDRLIFERKDQENWMFGLEMSDCGKYLIMEIFESTAPVNRLYYIDLEDKKQYNEKKISPIKLIDNFDAQYEYITNDKTCFYFKTNLNAPRGRVIKIDIKKPDPSGWKEVIPHKVDVLSSVMCVGHNFLFVTYMRDVKDILESYDLNGKFVKEVPLPTVGSIVEMRGRKKDTELFFKFTSFLHPGTISAYDVTRQTATVFREIRVHGFEAEKFETKQVFYNSKDGTVVPMFIVSKKDLKKDGSNPTLLYGYGGFNIPFTPSFSPLRLIFLQHYNGILAIPNLRGGGEYGEEWHQGGILGKKQNVFDDFHSAAQYLIDMNYTKPKKLSIMGGSNGGLLVGACMNQMPHLYGCAIAQVGVLDMLRFHKFTIGHAWMAEYGDPDDEKDCKVLHKYSPLHNVQKGKQYPAVLLCTADHDDRVVPLHSYKMISELQHRLGEHNREPLMIRIDTKSGHGFGKPVAKLVDEYGDIYSFITDRLGATWTD